MGITNAQAMLQKRYSALTGQLADLNRRIEDIRNGTRVLPILEADVGRLEGLIAAVEMLLRDGYPDWSPEQSPAKKPWEHGIPIPFGSCGRRARALLRTANRAMTAREVAIKLLRQSGCEEPDRDVLRRTQTAVEASFRKFKGRGVQSSGQYPAQWRASINSKLEFDL